MEANLLARLQHPVIVRSFGVALDGERPHLVLEHLEGPRLSTLLRRYGLALEQMLPLALQLCSALHTWRSAGRPPGREAAQHHMTGPPRLIDLSVATPLDEVQNISGPIGTTVHGPRAVPAASGSA